MSNEEEPIEVRGCVCRPSEHITCGYHADHPVTRSRAEIERLIRFNDAEMNEANKKIRQAHDIISHHTRYANQLYGILDGLYSDLSLLRRLKE